MYLRRILLDGSKEACRGSCDGDARGDGQNGEDGGGLCEHGVDFLGVCLWWVKGYQESREKVVDEGKVKKDAPQMSGR